MRKVYELQILYTTGKHSPTLNNSLIQLLTNGQ